MTPVLPTACVDTLPRLARVRLGRTLASTWKLEELLDVDVLSACYRATHSSERTGRLHLPHAELATSRGICGAFRGAANIARMIEHRGVACPIDDGHTEEGLPYVVFPDFAGEPLGELIRRRGGRIAPSEALRIGAELLDVLAEVHETGLVHGYVGPSTVFLGQDGCVRLFGFGWAALQSEAGLHFAPAASALPRLSLFSHLAPPSAVDVRATGASLFALLTGMVPGSECVRGLGASPPLRHHWGKLLHGLWPEAPSQLKKFLDQVSSDLPSASKHRTRELANLARQLSTDPFLQRVRHPALSPSPSARGACVPFSRTPMASLRSRPEPRTASFAFRNVPVVARPFPSSPD